MPVTADNSGALGTAFGPPKPALPRGRSGFSLVELMVAMAVFLLIMIVIATMLEATNRATRRPIQQAQTFEQARTAFELMTRRLSQATLNTYWGYDNPNAPSKYQRSSELNFVTGQSSTLLGTNIKFTPTQAVFFQAPLGYSATANTPSLPNLLNACGFFINFDSDTNTTNIIPSFLQPNFIANPNYRFRLYQWVQSTDSFGVYSFSSDQRWFTNPLVSGGKIVEDATVVQAVAQNVIALVFHPCQSQLQDPTGIALSSDFTYDSRKGPTTALTYNQLPPEVDVIMVAIDEASAIRLAQQDGSTPPDFGLQPLFQSTASLNADLATLQTNLQTMKVNYRLFRTTVVIAAAKWSGY